jgi:hypothetical protein
MYVIITNSYKQKDVTLFLIDRSKTKSSWWSTELDNNVLYMRNIKAARRICNKLKHNSPRVITVKEARKLAEKNANIKSVISMFDERPFSINNVNKS